MSIKSKSFGDSVWSTETLKFVMDNSKEMSLTELAIHTGESEDRIKAMCNKYGYSYYTEIPQNWRRKGYIVGPNGYALYPHKSTYRESASVQNSMLDSGDVQ